MASQSIIQTLTAKFQAHKQSHFTGIFQIELDQTPYWTLFFNLGRLVWAETPIHPVRQWYRQVFRHCPESIQSASSRDIPEWPHRQDKTVDYEDLHYCKLVTSVRNGTLNRIHFAEAVESYLCEVLFDIVQQITLRQLQTKPPFTFTDKQQRLHSEEFLIVRAEQAWQQAQSDWSASVMGLSSSQLNLTTAQTTLTIQTLRKKQNTLRA
ncbi:MAG: hypothetical protein AAF703_00030 [Cyanobacteria bacterium P01_D01_bin.105]